MTYRQLFEIAEIAIRNQRHKFFTADAARKAAIAGVNNQHSAEAMVQAMSAVLEAESHVCYFDDPCDAWAA